MKNKIQVWELEVFESALDWSHGMSETIVEFVVRDIMLAINEKACFLTEDNRYTFDSGSNAKLLSEFTITDELMADCVTIAKNITLKKAVLDKLNSAFTPLAPH